MAEELFHTDGPIEISLDGPITLDLGAVSDEPIAIGIHSVKIERAEARLSRKQSLPMIFVLSRIVDEADLQHNKTVIWNNMMVGEGLVFTKRCFKALGLPEVLNYPSMQDLADDLVGRTVDVVVKHRVREGEVQANVSGWSAPTLG